MSTRHDYIHPALRAAVNELLPAPLDPTGGPLTPNIPSPPQLSYDALIAERARDDGDRESELTMEQLAAFCRRFPLALFDALAEHEHTAQNIFDLMSQRGRNEDARFRNIGAIVVGAVRDFATPVIDRQVQSCRARMQQADAIEDLGSHFPKTDEARELMTELGLGRVFES